jgi:excisionase family DNA binding protein
LAVSDRLLTTRQVADFLGLSPETVLRRWRAGEIPGYRLASNVLRFRESEIEAWLEHRCRRSHLTGNSIPGYCSGTISRKEERNEGPNVGESATHG